MEHLQALPSSQDSLLTIIFALASGIFLVILAHHFRISMIIPLLIGGVLIGPHFLDLLNPEQGLGPGLKTIISLAIAVVLFEGGLSLKLEGLRQAPTVIKRLLSVGVMITWFGVSISVYFLFDFTIAMSLLAGSLVIVTGPTVVQPLIRRIGVNEKLQQILSWEAILIDPIGVFIALLCFEWVVMGTNSVTNFIGFEIPAQLAPFLTFFLRSFTGIAVGVIGGIILDKILRTNIIPTELLNVGVLAFVLLVFGICEMVEHETGILAVTITGFWLALKDSPYLKEIKKFKLQLSDMAVGLLFVLLASKLNIDNFSKLGINGLILIAIVVFGIRPLSVFISTYKTNVSLNEKIFLSWLAPRGIVAASMAAIVTLYLSDRSDFNQVYFFETFTYAIIGTTVLLQGSLSGGMAKLLDVKSPDRNGWLIAGISKLSIEIARFMRRFGVTVTLIDTNGFNVAYAKEKGFDAIHGDALNINLLEVKYLARIGHILAITDNKDLNARICQEWNEIVPRNRLYRWEPSFVQTEREEIGHIVFSEISKPSNLSNEIENEYSHVRIQTIDHDQTVKKRNSVLPLMHFSGGNFQFAEEESETFGTGIHLLVERNNFYLARVMADNLVTTMEVDNYDELLIQLMKHISKVIPIIPYERTLKDLITRETLHPTLVGNGVAIPHTYCPELNKSICLIAKMKKPILTAEKDKESVKLVFLLISPPENPKMHLRILSDIAKLVSNKDILDKITLANSASEIIKILNSVRT
jgi:NhaP-type Na+/H+ or K+/H+ antiporter/mannitol/fructose-specific phosphotransferase system IIA component (Ntr-type)